MTDKEEQKEEKHYDFFGKEIKVGDTVVYFRGAYAQKQKSYEKDVITSFTASGNPRGTKEDLKRGSNKATMCFIGVIKYEETQMTEST